MSLPLKAAASARSVVSWSVLVVGILAVVWIVLARPWLVVETDPEREVRGVLVDLQASSLIYADTVSLRDESGTVYDFRVDPQVSTNREEPQSAGHLRQHMALAEPMIVRYVQRPDGGLLAVRILDAG